MADAFALSHRCVFHLDLDSFFLSVHKRRDPTLPLDSKPVVLYQFQDVICANRRAKALGVQKHMRPREARALVEPHGVVLHAFCRDWPGPRVRYGPYNAASREFFDALADALTATGGGAAIERGSIDEGFVELEKPRDPAAFCGRLRAAVEGATGLRVTVGCGPNKLLAKLASSAAKGTDAAVRVEALSALQRAVGDRAVAAVGAREAAPKLGCAGAPPADLSGAAREGPLPPPLAAGRLSSALLCSLRTRSLPPSGRMQQRGTWLSPSRPHDAAPPAGHRH